MNNSDVHCRPDYHLGHVVLEHLKLHTDTIFQIDAATGDEETYSSVLVRTVRLARALRNYGLKPGEVLAIGGRNHLDLHIPIYSALFNGLPSVGIDPYYKYDEVKTLINLTKPKIAFCQNEHVDVYSKVAKDLDLDIKLVTFDDGDCKMAKFIDQYYSNEPLENFKVSEIDINKVNAFLVSTSGTTGKVKLAAINHKPFMLKWISVLKMLLQAKTYKGTLITAPVVRISTTYTIIATPLTGDTKIQTSKPDDFDHIIDIINKYKPRNALMSTTLMTILTNRKDVDLECFRSISVNGSKIYSDDFEKFRKLLSKEAALTITYGQTEMLGPVLMPTSSGPLGTCGKPIPFYDVKLIDPDTKEEIKEPHVTGEMWVKGPCFTLIDPDTKEEIKEPHVTGEMWVKGPCFTEYYQDPEETAAAFTEDGYVKTGDLLYRDEDNYYFYVERIKALIKYRNSNIMPIEVEDVIRKHPSVKEVCVIGIPDSIDGEHPVACVVLRPGEHATAKEIKDLVASKLSKTKELRGGVVFFKEFPQTSSEKIASAKLVKIVMNSNRE